jgi:DNA-dependent metalloprotease WSS1
MESLMDTMLHELCHNVFTDHNEKFYGLFDEVKRDWELLSSKGYQGEGFFSQGQRLGSGHMFYKPNSAIATTASDRRRIKDVAEGRGITIGAEGRRSGGGPQTITVQEGRRLAEGGNINQDADPRQLAAMAALKRARDKDQQRCGARQPGAIMKREYERAQRDGTKTLAPDIDKVIPVHNLSDASSTTAKSLGPSTNGLQSHWACLRCTFLNPPLYLSCQICQEERKLGDMPNNHISIPDEFAVSWDCQVCTFKNEDVKDGKCVVCGTEI